MDNSASDSLGSLIGNEDVNAYGSVVQGDEAIENSGTEVCKRSMQYSHLVDVVRLAVLRVIFWLAKKY